jgi:indole-3-glycerol phosphate synthase
MTARDFLQRMADASRARTRAARQRVGEAELLRRAESRAAPPQLSLARFDVIAELKLRSPAAGGLATTGLDRAAQIRAYAQGGAAAVSVLTEPDEFKGTLEHLREAAATLAPLDCPVMRKDFLTDPYQIIEARAAGAGGVLLIATMLDDALLRAMLATAADLGLFVLLEAFDAADLERIAALDFGVATTPVLAGLNSRNLKNLQVDFGRFAALANALPRHLPVVAESGIGSVEDIRDVVALGYRLALVGSALMRTDDPAGAVRAFVAAGRTAAERGAV